jgi:hypothetical protein
MLLRAHHENHADEFDLAYSAGSIGLTSTSITSTSSSNN